MVKIYRSAYLGMTRDAESGYPYEVCGVMVGKGDTVTHFRKCANLVADDKSETAFKKTGDIDSNRLKDRYELDPRSYIEADSWARENGLEILGIYHSHPDHPSVPSETDRQVASPEWAYIIFSVNRGEFSDARIWCIDEQSFQFEERKFEIVKDPLEEMKKSGATQP